MSNRTIPTQKIGKKLIFRKFVCRNGKVYFPRHGKCFAFWVDV